MLNRVLLTCVCLCALGCGTTVVKDDDVAVENISPPVAKKQPHVMTIHEHSRVDNYFWMRDDERKQADVLDHLNAENAYGEALLSNTSALQESLFQEITQRMEKDDSSVPIKYKNYYYYSRFSGEQEYPVYARKKSTMDAQEEVLLDVNLMAEGFDYYRVGDYSVSTNEQLLAYSVDTLSRRIYTIYVKNLATGSLLTEKLENTSGQVFWANDNKTLFYIRKDPETLLGYQVYRHQLGSAQSDDVLVYEEKDKSFYTWLEKTKDDSHLLIVHDSTDMAGASILDLTDPLGDFERFYPLEKDHEYSIKKIADWFYIYTNWQAKNFRIMRVHKDYKGERSRWQEVVSHNPSVFLKDFDVFRQHLVINEKEQGQSRIRVLNIKDKRSHVIDFKDPVYVVNIDSNVDMDSQWLRLSYSSLTTPYSIFDYHLASRDKVLKKQDRVLGDFNASEYDSERIFIRARDGEKVPVSLVYKKSLFNKDASNPMYLYGYGAYGHSIEPYFSSARLSLLERGFVVAIAHVRGSQTLGRPWYDDGKMFNKQNTFTDFIDVTKGLVELQYAAADKVFAVGGSAGGLLIGAVINMAPDLYRAVVAHVPFVDVVTTMLDETIPLTTNEYGEWGNPNKKADYEYMLSYSPYDNVKAQDYPNILVTSGLHDSQVQYFEPAKWVAKLRELKTDEQMLVFKVDMETGHGGASGRFRRNRDKALEYAFFLNLLAQ